MPRYKLTIEYDGGPFVGWQRQDNGLSVQQALEDAVEALCQVRTVVYGAGRTDAGVHALGQVAHIEIAKDMPSDKVRDALNFHLRPHPIAILQAELAAPDFHARFSATGRAYLYRILMRRAPAALERGHVWHLPFQLDAGIMHEAAQELIGHHDFTSFRSSECQAPSPMKTLDQLSVCRAGDEIHVTAKARSFLHNQVRIMVGTLKLVGEGKWSARDVAKALAAADRTRGGPTAPPDGLYLTEVGY